MAAKRRWITRKPNLPVICFTIHDDHAFYYKRNNERGEAIQSISQMALRTSLQSFPACKIDICGEEEREKFPALKIGKIWMYEFSMNAVQFNMEQRERENPKTIFDDSLLNTSSHMTSIVF